MSYEITKKPLRNYLEIFSAAAIILGPIYLVVNIIRTNPAQVKQGVETTNGAVQQNTGDASTQSITTVTGDNNTVITGNTGQVEGISTLFDSDFTSQDDWNFSDGLKTSGGIISYSGKGQTELNLTKKKFSQTNTYVVTFVPISTNPDLVLRVENSFDIRFGDGGPDEVALYKFSRTGNWPPEPLQNPNAERVARWQLPCWVVPGNVVVVTINVSATGEFHKDVSMLYEYQCKSGKVVTPQDEGFESAFWSFSVPQATNVPASFGVGLNDPKGKDYASVEIRSVSITNP